MPSSARAWPLERRVFTLKDGVGQFYDFSARLIGAPVQLDRFGHVQPFGDDVIVSWTGASPRRVGDRTTVLGDIPSAPASQQTSVVEAGDKLHWRQVERALTAWADGKIPSWLYVAEGDTHLAHGTSSRGLNLGELAAAAYCGNRQLAAARLVIHPDGDGSTLSVARLSLDGSIVEDFETLSSPDVLAWSPSIWCDGIGTRVAWSEVSNEGSMLLVHETATQIIDRAPHNHYWGPSIWGDALTWNAQDGLHIATLSCE